jgi:hypothetical protein
MEWRYDMVVQSERHIENNPLVDTNMAIVVTSYNGHLPFLKYALSRYRETKKYVILSYDRHGGYIPADIMDIPHSVVCKHVTYGAEKRNGWLWDIIYASGIISLYNNIEYIITTNGDCVWDKPKNVDKLVELIGKHSIMSASSNSVIHTCNVIWKRECFLAFVDYIKNKLSVNHPQSYSPEVLLRDFVGSTVFTNKTLPEQPRFPKNHFYAGKVDHYSSYNQPCTWSKIIGYRNLGGEHKAACQEHLEPVNKKYFDLRNDGEFLNQHEKSTLYWYFFSGDRRYLYKYWAEGEDSYWNRRYYKLVYYGTDVLYDDSKRKELGPPSERLGHFDRWKYNSFILKDDEYYSKWKKVIEG